MITKTPFHKKIKNVRSLVVGLYPNGKIDERNQRLFVGNLKGEPGKSCMVSFVDGHGYEFNGHAYSDVVDVIAARLGGDARFVIRWLQVNGWLSENGGVIANAPAVPEPKRPTYRLRIAAPDTRFPSKTELDFWAENQQITPIGPPDLYAYRAKDGGIVLLVVRYPTAEGKEVRRASWTGRRWQLGGTQDAVLPLYRLPDLLARPEATVLICEGEKATDAAAELWPQYACTCPVGGSGPAPTSWRPLEGRDVLVLGDNDDAGKMFVLRLRDYLDGIVERVRMLRPQDVYTALGGYGQPPKGWDVADWN